MWNPHRLGLDDDDSSEVRAFAEDTKNTMSTTWPPRSYTCTFCRREFRSAQALGGHMNVHRHDRARLHQVPPPRSIGNSMIPSQETTKGHGLCFLYQLSNPNGGFNSSSALNSGPQTPPAFLSMSPYQPKNPTFPFSWSTHFQTNNGRFIKAYEPLVGKFSGGYEELDLELRLGQKPTPS